MNVLPITPVGKLKALGTAGSVYAISDFENINHQLVDTKSALTPKEQATEPIQAIAEMPVEQADESEEAASADPNAGVNYNVANIGSDDLLEDD